MRVGRGRTLPRGGATWALGAVVIVFVLALLVPASAFAQGGGYGWSTGWGQGWGRNADDIDPFAYRPVDPGATTGAGQATGAESRRSFFDAAYGTDEDDEDDRSLQDWVNVIFTTSFGMRLRDGVEDFDLFSVMSIEAGDPTVDRITGAGMLLTSWDLNGTITGVPTGLPSGTDAFADPVYVEAPYFYVSIQDFLAKRLTFTFGRIELEHFDGPTFDGAHFDVGTLDNVSFQVFGGVPYYTFDDNDRAGDWIAGSRVVWQPHGAWRLEYDANLTVDQDRELGERINVFQAARAFYASDRFIGTAEFNMRDLRPRELSLMGIYRFPVAQVELRGAFVWWFNHQFDAVPELSVFFSVAEPVHPYLHFMGAVSKLFGREWRIEAGVNIRSLEQGKDKGLYNQDWFQVYFQVGAQDPFGVRGLFGSFDISYYRALGQNEIMGIGGELGYRIKRDFRFSVGTRYDLYSYDRFYFDERVDAQSWFVKLRYNPSDWFTLNARYEASDMGGSILHALRFGLAIRF